MHKTLYLGPNFNKGAYFSADHKQIIVYAVQLHNFHVFLIPNSKVELLFHFFNHLSSVISLDLMHIFT